MAISSAAFVRLSVQTSATTETAPAMIRVCSTDFSSSSSVCTGSRAPFRAMHVDVGRDAVVGLGIGEPHRPPEPCRGLGIGTGALGRFGQRVGPPAGEDRHAERQIDELTSLAGLGDLVVGEPVGAQEVDELGPHGLNVHT